MNFGYDKLLLVGPTLWHKAINDGDGLFNTLFPESIFTRRIKLALS